jgi:hypothetical protein
MSIMGRSPSDSTSSALSLSSSSNFGLIVKKTFYDLDEGPNLKTLFRMSKSKSESHLDLEVDTCSMHDGEGSHDDEPYDPKHCTGQKCEWSTDSEAEDGVAVRADCADFSVTQAASTFGAATEATPKHLSVAQAAVAPAAADNVAAALHSFSSLPVLMHKVPIQEYGNWAPGPSNQENGNWAPGPSNQEYGNWALGPSNQEQWHGKKQQQRRQRQLADQDGQNKHQRARSPTTVMLSNIPCKYSRALLLDMIDGEGFADSYNFLYLPMDFDRGLSLGYAFVNLLDFQIADTWMCLV